ncbi:MAG: hypothetical protein IJZ78_03610 [Alistipes sp.]|nr:hypothetical protein [Alistipes sp.]
MSRYKLLRNYTAEENEQHQMLIERAINELPFSLAHPLDQLRQSLDEEDYYRSMILALDLVEVSLQWLSTLMLVRLISHPTHSAKSMERMQRVVTKIDTKRSLSMGDWLVEIFVPLATSLREDIPNDPMAEAIAKHLFKGNACRLLGDKREPSVVNIRNEYRGHSTTLSQELYRGVVYTLETHLLALLNATAPLHSGDYYSTKEDVARGPLRISHKGSATHDYNPSTEAVAANHYYATIDTASGRQTYDLFPLIYCSDEGYVYIFQTLGEDNIAYISSNIHAPRIHHDNYNDHFDALLQNIDKSFDISKELNWEEIQQALSGESKRYLARIYSEKKYNRELFIDHRDLTALLHDFYASDKTILPLLGEAGQGKTNQLCFWAEEHINNADGVVIFSSSDFAVMGLETRLRKILGYGPRRDIHKIVDMMHARAVQSGKQIYVIFDALNECLSYADTSDIEGPLALYNEIYRILISPSEVGGKSRYPNIKILFSCRSYTFKSLFGGIAERDGDIMLLGGDNTPTAVRGFSGEELQRAYGVYQELYQMETPFDELSRVATVRLKDPLVLKIASANYLSRSLPEDIHSYASITLFDKMFRDMESSYAGHKQGEILLRIGSYILDGYLGGQAIDSISEAMLHEAYDDVTSPVHQLSRLIYKQDGTSVAYGELINRPERPILRLVDVIGSDSKSLQFIYERFLEYILARVFVARMREGIASYIAIAPERYIESLTRAKTNVVFMGAMRNALIIDLLHTHDYTTLLTLARDYSSNYEASALISDVCNTLVRENYEGEIFRLIELMLNANLEDGTEVTAKLNALTKKIDKGQATSDVIRQHRELHSRLEPIIRLRQMALVNTFNGLLLSDYFNEELYTLKPMELVWRMVCDPIKEVADDACTYAYYLSNHSHTLDYTPLKRNLTEYIVEEMYALVKSRSLLTNLAVGRLRRRAIIFIESAVRITTLLIIDSLLSETDEGRKRVVALIDQVRDIMRYVSGRWLLIRVVMPFLQLIMRKQITFQSSYVNNAIEYQRFWDDGAIPHNAADEATWDRVSLRECLSFLGYSVATDAERQTLDADFERFRRKIVSCYATGDSFSYFVVERMLIVMGVSRWESLYEMYRDDLFRASRQSPWNDYSQMSLLYNLFHTGLNIELRPELLALYSQQAEDWTLRCRGEFVAPYSAKANTKGRYKRNVLSWYAALYCTHSGDNRPLEGDNRCVPLIYKLIDQAIDTRDKELLFHLMDNISEIVTDFGFVNTALALVYHILSRIDNSELLNEIDSVKLDRDGIYSSDTATLIGNILSTAKNYQPIAVDTFLRRDIVGLSFPAISQYREDILGYNPSGESLSDLLTHKFGKFVVWTLIHQPEVNAFARRAVDGAVDAKSCFDWYDKVVRLAFRELFRINV